MGFEVNIRKPSPEFDGAEECPCFQQTRFWAEFKAAHGWKMLPLDIRISRTGGAEADSGGSHDAGSAFFRVFVMTRSFAKGLFSVAYVPLFPIFDADSAPAQDFCEVLEKVALALRPHLPDNAICVRFDPMLEFGSASDRDGFVREARSCAGNLPVQNQTAREAYVASRRLHEWKLFNSSLARFAHKNINGEGREISPKEKQMKGIYLEKNKNIAYFIERYQKDEFVEINSSVNLIEKSALAHSDVEKVLFNGCSANIGEKAFEGCEELDTVIFGELGKDEVIKNATLKNLTIAPTDNNYTIQADAFKGCGKLTTLVLPKLTTSFTNLTIEQDAFSGCKSLRTVVALCDEIDVTGNPFADEAEHLTFVCKKNSDAARFARENGYRTVYAD